MGKNTTSIEARRLAKIWHDVKTSGKPYSKTTFTKIGGATGARLWEVLLVAEWYNQISDCHPKFFIKEKGKMKPNIPVIWDEDDYAKAIDDFVFKKASDLGIAILKNRGRIKGVSPRKKVAEPIVEESIPENPPQMMADIVIELDESPASILDDVEIVDPQILEDEVVESEDLLKKYGYNPLTGEYDNIPEEPAYTISKPSDKDIYKGLSDDDLILELKRRHPMARVMVRIDYEL